MKNYQAILFHPAGDYVTDFKEREQIKDVWNEVNEMGSRWIFYPLVFVGTDKTILDTPDGLEFLKGKRIKSIQKYLSNIWENSADDICEVINQGYPLTDIYYPI